MTTTVIYADATWDTLYSVNTVYATMQGGTNFQNRGGVDRWRVGQGLFTPDYYGFESFIAFDTSVIGAATVSAAVLTAIPQAKESGNGDFIVEVYAFDWGTTVDMSTVDWRSATQLNALTLLASFDTTTEIDLTPANFTSTGSFPAAINTSGMTRLVVASNLLRTGSAPAGTQQDIYFYGPDEVGTTNDPFLTVTSAPSVPAGAATPEAGLVIGDPGSHIGSSFVGSKTWADAPELGLVVGSPVSHIGASYVGVTDVLNVTAYWKRWSLVTWQTRVLPMIPGTGRDVKTEREWETGRLPYYVGSAFTSKMYTRVAGAWVLNTVMPSVRVSGAWVTATAVYVRISGAWVQIQ